MIPGGDENSLVSITIEDNVTRVHDVILETILDGIKMCANNLVRWEPAANDHFRSSNPLEGKRLPRMRWRREELQTTPRPLPGPTHHCSTRYFLPVMNSMLRFDDRACARLSDDATTMFQSLSTTYHILFSVDVSRIVVDD
jgi:hypothetical protein